MENLIQELNTIHPKVHCITNPVTMLDMANCLLAAKGSAIMASDPIEVADITTICNATLLNTGVPSLEKFEACIVAGKQANKLNHPVVLDPVGVGASSFRKEQMARLLSEIHVDAIRCNQEEAKVLLKMKMNQSGGVDSSIVLDMDDGMIIADKLAQKYQCVVLMSGKYDICSDGKNHQIIEGGDEMMSRITGSGCMLSSLVALFLATTNNYYQAIVTVSRLWKQCALEAKQNSNGYMGSFHSVLFDMLDKNTREDNLWIEKI